MATTEILLRNGNLPNMSEFRIVNYPPIITPENIVDKPTIVLATELAQVPYHLGVLPGRNRPAYARFDLRGPSKTAQPPQKTTLILPTFKFEEGSDPIEIARQVDRGMLRTSQYERIIEMISDWDEQLKRGLIPIYYFDYESEGIQKREASPVTPKYLDRLKHLAATFYANELSAEPITKELAKEVKARQVLDEQVIIRNAERIIFDHRKKNPSDIEVKQTEIACQTNKRLLNETNNDEQITQSVDKTQTLEQEKTPQDLPEEAPLSTEAVLTAIEEIIKLDRPNQNSTRYLEQLWKKPF